MLLNAVLQPEHHNKYSGEGEEVSILVQHEAS